MIAPRSVVQLKNFPKTAPMWEKKVGRFCRIGFYSKKDGLNIVWLVDQNGGYVETVEQDDIVNHFNVVSISSEKDVYGETSLPLEKIQNDNAEWKWTF